MPCFYSFPVGRFGRIGIDRIYPWSLSCPFGFFTSHQRRKICSKDFSILGLAPRPDQSSGTKTIKLKMHRKKRRKEK